MERRPTFYIVPTDRWYIERAVWLIAGVFVLAATSLAVWLDSRFVLLITATGLASINVSLNGFCIIGNILHRFGFRGALAERGDSAKWYFMKTDRWYLERRIYLVVGFNLCLASILTLVHSRWWLAFPGFVGVAMLWFAVTGFCIMANALYWTGAEPRLVPEARRDAIGACATAPTI
ncbi:MAG TPA: DUF2892 domain-containing protein [Thermoanaerobaculia bacterium]